MDLSKDVVYGSGWRKVRLAVLERDEWLCQIRGDRCLVRASEVDHRVLVVGWRVGARSVEFAACKRCNSSRGGQLGAARGALDWFSAQRRPSREW
jgi:5-methylcytosine-specific restriction endonuclease McrA